MNVSECDRLEDYLGGGLSAGEASGFAAHLAGCRACRKECELHQRINRLLAQAARQSDPVPASLIGRIQRQVRSSSRRRTLRYALGLAASAAIVLAVGIGLVAGPFGARTTPKATAVKQTPSAVAAGQVDSSSRPASATRPAVHVALRHPSDAILQPLETEAPNVSIVWIYPTVKPARTRRGPATD